MRIRILKEAYSPEVIDSYLKDVYNAYDRLRDCLYALSHAVEDDKKLESTVDSVIYDLEDDFYDYMKFHLEDVENSIHPKEEEEDEEEFEEEEIEDNEEEEL